MGKVLDYLLEQGCVLRESELKMPEGMPNSRDVRTAKGDYVTLETLTEKDSIPKDIIYKHKLTQLQALDEGSGNSVSLGFNEKEQAWYGWTHRGFGSFKIGQKIKEGTAVTASRRFPVPAGFVCKTLDDCKFCAKAMADVLD